MKRLTDPRLVSLVAALALVAQSEWALARAVGWPAWIAWAAPLALDAYVVAAIRSRRDLGPSVIVSAVSVIASHAVYAAPRTWEGGVVGQGSHLIWWLAAVCSVVPLLVTWRVHSLHTPQPVPVQAPKPVVVAPEPKPQPAPKPVPAASNGKAQVVSEEALVAVVRPLVEAGKGRPFIEKALADAGLPCGTRRLQNLMSSLKEPALVS